MLKKLKEIDEAFERITNKILDKLYKHKGKLIVVFILGTYLLHSVALALFREYSTLLNDLNEVGSITADYIRDSKAGEDLGVYEDLTNNEMYSSYERSVLTAVFDNDIDGATDLLKEAKLEGDTIGRNAAILSSIAIFLDVFIVALIVRALGTLIEEKKKKLEEKKEKEEQVK